MNSAEANTPLTAIQEQKKAIREQAHANRKDQEHKDELSREICARFMALPEYQRARTAMFYVDVRTEVRTRQDLATALAHGKTIVVPWCNDQGELELFRLESMEDLALGMYKILEPKPELRHLPERQVMVPGVAFTREGARMGHGKGYYDKLLEHARPDAPLVALAFECQLFPEIPTQSHDVFMDKIITEKGVYTGKGRSRS
jgi:5-formyltetrahydrofolate cyclo-ligase